MKYHYAEESAKKSACDEPRWGNFLMTLAEYIAHPDRIAVMCLKCKPALERKMPTTGSESE